MDLRARRHAAEAERVMGRRVDSTQRGEDGAFDRLEEAVAEAEAHTEIERELRGDTIPLDEKLQREEQLHKIDAELDALRRKFANGGNQ